MVAMLQFKGTSYLTDLLTYLEGDNGLQHPAKAAEN